MVVAMTPSFYAPKTPTDPPGNVSHYRDFVSALMHRYRSFNGKRGISSYQVWNEANIGTFWTGTKRQLAVLSKTMRDVRNRVDPKATVVSPAMVTRLPYQLKWLKTYYGMKLNGTPVWKFYDTLGFSLYPLPTHKGRPAGPEDSMRLFGQVKSRLRKDHVPGSKPIWNTEINYGLQTGSLGGTHAAPTRTSSRRRTSPAPTCSTPQPGSGGSTGTATTGAASPMAAPWATRCCRSLTTRRRSPPRVRPTPWCRAGCTALSWGPARRTLCEGPERHLHLRGHRLQRHAADLLEPHPQGHRAARRERTPRAGHPGRGQHREARLEAERDLSAGDGRQVTH